MGNGKKAVNGTPQRPDPAEASKDFVVVLAHTSDDGEIEEDFMKFVQDVKALYTFKNNVRVYATVGEAAQNVLGQVEKPKEGQRG
jgi:flavodoxin